MQNPQIEWKGVPGANCLYFKFGPYLTATDAVEAIKRWKLDFTKRPGQRICLIWDCLEMTGYEKDARIAWQATISELKNQIGEIWLVTRSPLIKVGASVIATFTRLNIKSVNSLEELSLKKR